MSTFPKKPSLGSLEVLTRLRKLEETKKLKTLTECRAAMEKQREHLEALRAEQAAVLRQLESFDTISHSNSVDGLVQHRAFLERLRRSTRQAEKDLDRLQELWAASQKEYTQARAHRRVADALLERRRAALRKEQEARAEELAETPRSSWADTERSI